MDPELVARLCLKVLFRTGLVESILALHTHCGSTSIGKSNLAIPPCSWRGEEVTFNKVALGLSRVAMTSRAAGEGSGGEAKSWDGWHMVAAYATIIGAITILTLGMIHAGPSAAEADTKKAEIIEHVGNRMIDVIEQVGNRIAGAMDAIAENVSKNLEHPKDVQHG